MALQDACGEHELPPVELVLDRRAKRHGESLNQALDLIQARRELSTRSGVGQFVMVLDSDTIVLRRDAVSRVVATARELNAAVVGQFQFDALPDGYAHPCAMLLNIDKTSEVGARFDDSGAPATQLHQQLRQVRATIVDYPILKQHDVLHVGRATRRAAVVRRSRADDSFRWEPHYHAVPEGGEIHDRFLSVYRRHVADDESKTFITACLKTEPLEGAWLPSSTSTDVAN